MKNFFALIGLVVFVGLGLYIFRPVDSAESTSSATAKNGAVTKKPVAKPPVAITAQQEKRSKDLAKMEPKLQEGNQPNIVVGAILKEVRKLGIEADQTRLQQSYKTLAAMQSSIGERWPNLGKQLTGELRRLQAGIDFKEVERQMKLRVEQARRAASEAPKTFEETKKKLLETDRTFREISQKLADAKATYEKTEQSVRALAP